MRSLRRLDVRRRLRPLPLALVLVVACGDGPTTTVRTIPLAVPLQMDWPGKDQGAGYALGAEATLYARSELRVVWTVRIALASPLPDGRRPRYTQTFQNQDRFLFSWRGESASFDAFQSGDSCVATAAYEQMSDLDRERSQVVFVIGR